MSYADIKSFRINAYEKLGGGDWRLLLTKVMATRLGGGDNGVHRQAFLPSFAKTAKQLITPGVEGKFGQDQCGKPVQSRAALML